MFRYMNEDHGINGYQNKESKKDFRKYIGENIQRTENFPSVAEPQIKSNRNKSL